MDAPFETEKERLGLSRQRGIVPGAGLLAVRADPLTRPGTVELVPAHQALPGLRFVLTIGTRLLVLFGIAHLLSHLLLFPPGALFKDKKSIVVRCLPEPTLCAAVGIEFLNNAEISTQRRGRDI